MIPSACFPHAISCLHSWNTIIICVARYRVPLFRYTWPWHTLQGGVWYSLSTAMCSFPGPENKSVTLTDPLNCYNPECNWLLHSCLLFLHCRSTKSIAGSPTSSPLSHHCCPRPSPEQTDGLCLCLVLPPQATKAEAANPQFEVNRAYNLSLDSSLNFSSSWRQWVAHLKAELSALQHPLCAPECCWWDRAVPHCKGAALILQRCLCVKMCSHYNCF